MSTANELLQRGWQLHQSGSLDAAEQLYRQVLGESPQHPDALVFLGIALFDRRQFEASAAAYREAIAQREHFPVAWNNLGNSLRMTGRTEEAEACFERALSQRPGYLSALKNRGTLWVWSGDIDRGLRWYQEALRVAPDNAELHRNLGVIYLLLGRYEEGWEEYRYRWQMPGLTRPRVQASHWQGENLEARSILLYPEQGRGDAIQFVRVAWKLKRQGAAVYLQSTQSMIPLFSSAPGLEMISPEGGVLPPVDYHASLVEAVDRLYDHSGQLPFCENLFQPGSGYLRAPDELVDRWRGWLAQHAGERRIGINWQGNPQHHADVYRSLPLQAMQPLTELPGTTLVSLQFGAGTEQLDRCDFSESIVRLPAGVDSRGAFLDTAAVIRNLDAVVTSDTAVGHLAGALGVPVLMMLGNVPDWRWQLQGDRTPWYPSMRLFRQRTFGEWTDVVREVCRELSRRYERPTD